MARELGFDGGDGGGIVLYVWSAMVVLSIVAAAIFSCADGASKARASESHNDGSTCAAGCGGACGG
ncbi:PREDICTED: uncharacterized protein LOC104809237 [Tarenaya hassleriana]|uniref:uncharacterized protein LOC104809237 n=1 Tax=Tarenaya hassleriana TaxID=28532 RepID=UPI00053C3CCC|nr:PREDICTED: uncharacterized protein LOC104809237 [Tarenaya hassleriana]